MPLKLLDVPGIEDAYQPAQMAQGMTASASARPPSPPPPPPAESTPQGSRYSTDVERWRPLVSRYFRPEDVDKALYVISLESGGDPAIVNPSSGATGLFQILKSHGVNGADPETAIKWAANQVYNVRGNWGDWGEGVTYNGEKFGALGLKPYPGSNAPLAQGMTATATAGPYTPVQVQPAQRAQNLTATAYVAPEPGARLPTAEAAPQYGEQADIQHRKQLAEQGLIEDAFGNVRPPENLREQARLLDYKAGRTSTQALQTGGDIAALTIPAVAGLGLAGAGALTAEAAPGLLSGAGLKGLALEAGGQALFGTGASGIAERVLPKTDNPVLKEARNVAVAAPGFAVGPGGDVFKAATLASTEAGRIIGEAKGLPNTPLGNSGALVGGFVPGLATGVANLARGKLRGPILSAAEEAQPPRDLFGNETPPPEAKPLPGQTGFFGEEVTSAGQIKTPPPEMGSMRGEPFRGEQGGIQATAFTPEETGRTGQLGLEEMARVQPAGAPRELPPLGDIPRTAETVRLGDITFRPDVFQARDVEGGKPFGESRVQQLVSNFTRAAFTPPELIPDPQNPGKFIAYVGHHRLEALRRVEGDNAMLEAIVAHPQTPEQLATLQRRAATENFATAPPNYRETVRAAQKSMQLGASVETVAEDLRTTASSVERMLDASRLGSQALDRVVVEPSLKDYAEEIGRGMRVYGINEEDANGLFNRVATGPKGQRPTVAAVRDTIDSFGALYREQQAAQAQGALFGGELPGMGSRGGLLELIDQNARMRTEIEKAMRAIQRQMKGVRALANRDGGEVDPAVNALLARAQGEVDKLREALARNEENLQRAMRGEPLLEEPPTTPPPETQKPAGAGTPPAGEPPAGAGTPPAPGAGGAAGEPPPPSEPPPPGEGAHGQPPLGGEPPNLNLYQGTGDPHDALIEVLNAAYADRPRLRAERSAERSRRISEYIARVMASGKSAEEALREASGALRGQLADPSFLVSGLPPGVRDALFEEVVQAGRDGRISGFEIKQAEVALRELLAGQNITVANEANSALGLASSKVRVLGKVFGLRVQDAIERLGDVFQVQRYVEDALDGVPLEVRWADGTPLTSDTLAGALRANLPDLDGESIDRVAERLLEGGRASVVKTPEGRRAIMLNRDEMRRIGREAQVNMFPPDDAELPVVQPPSKEGVGLTDAERERMNFPRDFPSAAPMLGQEIPQGGTAEQTARQLRQETIAAERRAQAARAEQPIPFDIRNEVAGLLGLPRSAMAGIDVGAIGRQAQPLGWANRSEWRRAAERGLASFASEEAANAADDAVKASIWYSGEPHQVRFIPEDPRSLAYRPSAADTGLKIFDYGPSAVSPHPNFTGYTDSNVSRWVRKRIGFRNGERSYATTLNVLGMGVYEKAAESMWQAGVRDLKAYQDLASIVNHARGYGTGRFVDALSRFDLFFSTRNLVSRFQVLMDPFRWDLHPAVRAQAAKQLAGMLAGQASLLAFLGITGAMAGGLWSVDADPNSSDFGKVKIGNLRIDVTGGFSPLYHLIARGVSEGVDATAGTNLNSRDSNWRDELVRFFRNKESPLASIVTEGLVQRDSLGRPVDLTPEWAAKRLAQSFTPFLLQDVVEAWKNQDGGIGAKLVAAGLAAPASVFGFGTQTYRPFGAIDQGKLRDGNYPLFYLDANGNRQPVKTYADLKAADPAEADRYDQEHPGERQARLASGFEEGRIAAEKQQTFYQQQLQRDNNLLQTDPQAWRQQSGDAASRLSATIDGIYSTAGDLNREPRTLLDVANLALHNAIQDNTGADGSIDWEAVDRRIAELSPEEQQLLFSQRLKGETPARQQYIKDLSKLNPYFEKRDEAWRQFVADKPAIQKYKSFDEYQQSIVKKLMSVGTTHAEAAYKAQRLTANLEDQLSKASRLYLAQHARELLPLLDKYGYYIPVAYLPILRVLKGGTPVRSTAGPSPSGSTALPSLAPVGVLSAP